MISTKNKYYENNSNLFIASDRSYEKPLTDNKVVSLFSGAGGLDLGLEQAGFETVLCVEIDKDCRTTLRHNRPEWTLFEDKIDASVPGDIRALTEKRIFELSGLEKGEAALVAGGAPCQSFSNIGKRDGIESEKNGTLFLEFLRIVRILEPKAVLFENVVGITQPKHRHVLHSMESTLSDLGYSTAQLIMNSADYGVAQKRERFILLALKGDKKPAFPLQSHSKDRVAWMNFSKQLTPQPSEVPGRWLTVRKAFTRIPKMSGMRKDFAVMNISKLVKDRMRFIQPGQNFHALPMNMRPNCWKNGRHQGTDTFGRLNADEPSVTIRTAAYNPAKGRYIHPWEDRGLTTHEMAALQGFPYSWEFKSHGRDRVTLVSAGRQIGNAVPPPLARALGKAVMLQLLEAREFDSILAQHFEMNQSEIHRPRQLREHFVRL